MAPLPPPPEFHETTEAVRQRISVLIGKLSAAPDAKESNGTKLSGISEVNAGTMSERTVVQSRHSVASQRKFDVLLFWALDRLSREGVLETLQHLNRLTACGVGYRSFTEQYFDSCGVFKDAVIAIIATVAKQERVRISQRVRAGLDVARARGRSLGRPKVVVDSHLIAALRDQGRSWREIVKLTGVSKGTAQRAVRSLPKNV